MDQKFETLTSGSLMVTPIAALAIAYVYDIPIKYVLSCQHGCMDERLVCLRKVAVENKFLQSFFGFSPPGLPARGGLYILLLLISFLFVCSLYLFVPVNGTLETIISIPSGSIFTRFQEWQIMI